MTRNDVKMEVIKISVTKTKLKSLSWRFKKKKMADVKNEVVKEGKC